MKASQIAAKVVVRLFLFLILLALVPVFTGSSIDKQLQGIYLTTNNKWVLVYPILLILGFITLLIICTIKKYSKPDLNWLLVVNTVVLIVYGITVFIRISHLIK
ncbi:MAG: hypothetical protein ABIN91_07315 [Mucilaginibacter sp.]|uniref:hypothetical protein n=1 Tax=Mucilaginibacter sp. TaxID=1882438 RepID=UPI003265BBDB